MEQSDKENMARAAARRKAEARRRAARRNKVILISICVLLMVVLGVLLVEVAQLREKDPTAFSGSTENKLGIRDVTLEAGGQVTAAQFLEEPEKHEIELVTDISKIDLARPGKHEIALIVDGKEFTATLIVRDTVAPTGKPVEGATTDVGVLPEAQSLVTDVRDIGPVQVSYKQEPDVSKGGEITAYVLLTDQAGNTVTVAVELTVVADEEPPVIEGAMDREFYIGDTVAYKDGITVSDNRDEAPKLKVDNSQVDPAKPGTYPVTYAATDASGNQTSITVHFTFKEKPASYVEPEVVYDLAKKVLDRITTEDMTDMEVAFAIYRWVSTNIGYTGHSDKSSWTGAAYQAFTKYSGDCYNYFAAAKALYDVAGIRNVDVVKVVTPNTSQSSHYWSLINLGDGWYHVDCTPRSNPGFFFMNTDAELMAYSERNKNCHNFDFDAYPERATESVQDRVDYANGKIKD